MNKSILVGNLTRDPELSQTPNGTSVCKFRLAVNRPYANAQGEHEADFINIVTWRGLADSCGMYLRKGSKVAVCGQIQTRSYDDKNGEKRYVTEIVADDVEFISTDRKESPDRADKKEVKQEQVKFTPDISNRKKLGDLEPVKDDGLPF